MNPEPVPQTMSINDILAIHHYLKSVQEPSDAIISAITKIETFITDFINALQTQVKL